MNKSALLHLNDEHFKKTAKRLKSKINESKQTDFKISEIQELLAESLGFRNLHELKLNLEENKATLSVVTEEKQSHVSVKFEDLTAKQCKEIITLLIKNTNSEVYERSLMLLDVYIELIYWDLERNGNKISTDSLKKIIDFDFVFNLKNSDGVSEKIKEDFNFYYQSIHDNSNSMNIYNNHKMLSNQILPALAALSKIEKNNCIVFDSKWVKNREKIISNKSWPEYIDNIDNSAFIRTTLLRNESFLDFISLILPINQLMQITILDLLIALTEVINPHFRKSFTEVVNIFIHNYEQSKDLFKKINELM